LTVIDPDVVSWDNVARHVLGGAAVGRPKALELRRYLRTQVPTISTVTACEKTWQQVAAVSEAALRTDLIVSTIASWPDELALSEWARIRGVPLVVGWVESHAAAGHAVSLRGECLACQFSPSGHFRREVAKWDGTMPIRLADGCHEHFLPYGYANIVPTQSLIARLALEVLRGESVESTHRALVPSPDILHALGARPSLDCVLQQGCDPSTVSWAEHRRPWATDPNCWHCGGAR
jgi:molybdopterin/thiamine biosynthesis adenylyltransferase